MCLQVMYFSSLFPYIVLICFLVRALLLKGSFDGIRHMFTPKVRPPFDAGVSPDNECQITPDDAETEGPFSRDLEIHSPFWDRRHKKKKNDICTVTGCLLGSGRPIGPRAAKAPWKQESQRPYVSWLAAARLSRECARLPASHDFKRRRSAHGHQSPPAPVLLRGSPVRRGSVRPLSRCQL